LTKEHLHDLGKFMFAFSIFWTYCWFSQYMLIWYGNNGEETIYYHLRKAEYPVLFFGNLVIKFILPFFILMRNTTKRRYGTLFFTSAIVFFGHWFDFFYMIKPGVFVNAQEAMGHGHAAGHEEAGHTAEHAASFVDGFTIPGLLELGIFLGFTAFFIYFVFNQMTKAALLPQNDPYLEETLHHEVQPYE
jgi:Ni/Fe-hydrogenase subunit HybB-like protein